MLFSEILLTGMDMQQRELSSIRPLPRPSGDAGKSQFTPGELMTAHACLQEAYLGGDLDRERYEHTLKALKFVDEHGRIWSIGHQTGGWYYNFNFQWYPGEPHSMLSRMDSCSQVCLHCGDESPSRLAVYCIICGRPLQSLPDAASIVTNARPAPPRPGRLRRRLAVASLILALLVAAFLLYMYVSGKILYAGLFDPLILPALAAALVAANRRLLRT
jgi:hypothetical protein